MEDQQVWIIILGVIAGFFIFRDLLLWFWRVNHTTNRLEHIEELLHEISQKIKPDVEEVESISAAANEPVLKRSNKGNV
ncbi:hypothetical protein [Paenibacillus harenae]|uniref:Type VI protein secretion system component VasK n=1 Tax=Paenibacillus harenae TaxID=306543 RepID=A0ABT9U409_PAEHA|nr:hypothetical protein [Paenibacillus harenae]MDQ0114377.1 type VI protein secretion system component VasK [Paenibacillus harenae]